MTPNGRAIIRDDGPQSSGVGGGVVLFRGLRVRIGIASGVHSISDLSYVSGEARMHYSGPAPADSPRLWEEEHPARRSISPPSPLTACGEVGQPQRPTPGLAWRLSRSTGAEFAMQLEY